MVWEVEGRGSAQADFALRRFILAAGLTFPCKSI